MANIVLVEDNVAVRRSLADYLTVSGHSVSEVSDAAGLYGVLAETACDIAVVDINLPHYDGFSITRHLSEKQLCAVIITTVRDAVEDRVRGYRSGADIYMVKPVEPEELNAAIERLQEKRKTEHAAATNAGQSWSIDPAARRLWAPNGKTLSLSPRETRLIMAVATAPQGVVERDELLSRISDADEQATRARLDTLLSRLRSKAMKVTGMPLPLVTIHGSGLGFAQPVKRLG